MSFVFTADRSLELSNGSSRRPSGLVSELSGSTFDDEYYEEGFGSERRLDFVHLDLFGRQEETAFLKECYDRVANGSSELVLVKGSPGSGKSALVDSALRSYASNQGGYFTEGKFDQLSNRAPFSAIVAAFTDLCDLLMQSSDIEEIRAMIKREFVDEDIAVLSRLVSMVAHLAGVEDSFSYSSNDYGGSSSQAFVRIRLLCSAFLAKLSSAQHPIVLFLDDLQWADQPSLDVLNALLEDPDLKHVLFVVTYRANDFDETLVITNDQMHRSQLSVQNLQMSTLNSLVASLLSQEEDRTIPLTDLVLRKTHGNPYFALQFVESLQTRGLLFRNQAAEWDWDLVRIQEKTDVSDNVVELVEEKIRGLPTRVQVVLQIAAYIGHQFEFPLLFSVAVDEFLKRGLVGSTDSLAAVQEAVVRILNVTIREGLVESGGQTYKFTHDRVQQCLIAMVSSGVDREKFHLRLGNSILKYAKNNRVDNTTVLLAVDHLNKGSHQMSTDDQRVILSGLNLDAAKVTLARSALESAKEYARKGIALLDADTRWTRHYELSLDLHSTLAELGECTGDFQQSTAQVNDIIQHARSPQDQLRAYSATIETLLAQSQLQEALDTGFKVLKLLGHEFPSKPSRFVVAFELLRTKRTLKGMTDEQILNLPVTNEKHEVAVMRILNIVASVAYQKGNEKQIFALASMQLVGLSCKSGLTRMSSYGFACYAITLAFLDNIDEAYRFAKIALQLVNNLRAKEVESRTISVVYHLVIHWKEPFENCIEGFKRSFQVGMATGDITASFLSASGAISLSHHCGRPLNDTIDRLRSMCRQMKDFKQEESLRGILPFFQIVLNLSGNCEEPSELEGEAMDMLIGVHSVAEKDSINGRLEYSARLTLAVYFEKLDLAEYLLPLVAGKYQPAKAHYSAFQGAFASGMANYGLFRKKGTAKFRRKAEARVKQMAKWVENGGVNCGPPLLIMRAEGMAIDGLPQEEVLAAFDKAAAAARSMKFLQQEGIAYEMAASYLFDKYHSPLFFQYAAKALNIYNEWGAHAKIAFLEEKFNTSMESIMRRATQPSPNQ